jgi:peptide deformylase
MLLPIFAYGQPVLKKKAEPITSEYPDLATLIQNMWETMYNADGVGLAAPQIGLSIRLFMIDTLEVDRKGKEADTDKGLKEVFINAQMMEENGEPWVYEEGCLSIPRITGDVERPKQIRIQWQNEHFEPQEAIFTGINARVIQHEYDHIEGALFTEKLKPLKKRLIQRKLDDIRLGKIKTDYRMKFFNPRG